MEFFGRASEHGFDRQRAEGRHQGAMSNGPIGLIRVRCEEPVVNCVANLFQRT